MDHDKDDGKDDGKDEALAYLEELAYLDKGRAYDASDILEEYLHDYLEMRKTEDVPVSVSEPFNVLLGLACATVGSMLGERLVSDLGTPFEAVMQNIDARLQDTAVPTIRAFAKGYARRVWEKREKMTKDQLDAMDIATALREKGFMQ